MEAPLNTISFLLVQIAQQIVNQPRSQFFLLTLPLIEEKKLEKYVPKKSN